MALTWKVVDRANRVWFWFLLIVFVAAGASIIWGEPQLATIALAAALPFQLWRLSNERIVTATLDADGVTKQLGRDTWHRDWNQLRGVELRRVWGTDQLVLLGAAPTQREWSFSNRLLGLARIGSGAMAVQLAPNQVSAVRELLASHGVLPA